ncbi:MAG TPA: methyltransferase domain-containing protein [Candidatus Pacearchaeota archaeon]|nr:methyltransferase domain-containing protein [Candidatus Pacearchaeota archaeon]
MEEVFGKFKRLSLKLIDKNIKRTPEGHETIEKAPLIGGKLSVLSGVFNPFLTNVSPFLAKNLSVRWNGEEFLDIGCGTGFLSILLAKKGAFVLAVDKNPKAIECIHKNIKRFKLEKRISSKKSDLFDNIGNKKFDTIVFNPPLAPFKIKFSKKSNLRGFAVAILDPGFKVLKRFFRESKKYLKTKGRIILVYTNLAENIGLIKNPLVDRLCKKNNFEYKILDNKTFHGETYFVYEITPD